MSTGTTAKEDMDMDYQDYGIGDEDFDEEYDSHGQWDDETDNSSPSNHDGKSTQTMKSDSVACSAGQEKGWICGECKSINS